MERPTPIVVDPEVFNTITGRQPSVEDLERYERKRERERVWTDDSKAETVDELITALEEYRDRLGGDTPVQSFEAGHRIHAYAKEYDNGDTVVEL